MIDHFLCPQCQSTDYHIIPFRYLFKGRHLYGAKCRQCSLVSIFPRPSEEEIAEMYSDAYFTSDDVQNHHQNTDYFTAVEQVDSTEQINFLQKHLPPKGSVLEVGCATGETLFALHQKGHRVMGVEISAFAAGVAREKYGLDVVVAPFKESELKHKLGEGVFDLILMGDVLEHFTDPAEAMRYALRLLKKGGALIVHVPSTLNLVSSRLAFLAYRITSGHKTMTIPPYHLTEFFPSTLRRLYLASGFSQARIVQETKHPRTISLRHSAVENLLKLMFQYPNYYLTKLTGRFGDRLTGIGIK